MPAPGDDKLHHSHFPLKQLGQPGTGGRGDGDQTGRKQGRTGGSGGGELTDRLVTQ